MQLFNNYFVEVQKEYDTVKGACLFVAKVALIV